MMRLKKPAPSEPSFHIEQDDLMDARSVSAFWRKRENVLRVAEADDQRCLQDGALAPGRDDAVNLPLSVRVTPLTLFGPSFFSSWRKVYRSLRTGGSHGHRPDTGWDCRRCATPSKISRFRRSGV